MLAKRNGKRSRIHKRIYAKTDTVYYDLGRNDGKYLKITADGVRLAKNSHILFQRSELFAPQVEPEIEQVCAEDVKYFIAQHFNFRSETDQILFAAFLAGCFFGKQFSKQEGGVCRWFLFINNHQIQPFLYTINQDKIPVKIYPFFYFQKLDFALCCIILENIPLFLCKR